MFASCASVIYVEQLQAWLIWVLRVVTIKAQEVKFTTMNIYSIRVVKNSSYQV